MCVVGLLFGTRSELCSKAWIGNCTQWDYVGRAMLDKRGGGKGLLYRSPSMRSSSSSSAM